MSFIKRRSGSGSSTSSKLVEKLLEKLRKSRSSGCDDSYSDVCIEW